MIELVNAKMTVSKLHLSCFSLALPNAAMEVRNLILTTHGSQA